MISTIYFDNFIIKIVDIQCDNNTFETISVTGIKIVASYYHNGSADLWTLCGICDSNTSGDIQGQR